MFVNDLSNETKRGGKIVGVGVCVCWHHDTLRNKVRWMFVCVCVCVCSHHDTLHNKVRWMFACV